MLLLLLDLCYYIKTHAAIFRNQRGKKKKKPIKSIETQTGYNQTDSKSFPNQFFATVPVE